MGIAFCVLRERGTGGAPEGHRGLFTQRAGETSVQRAEGSHGREQEFSHNPTNKHSSARGSDRGPRPPNGGGGGLITRERGC
ncbi:hypothetical protein SKAU_G00332940 [Synaphobranchus kaupii]|uniref:Uncharacterized protein n=1 Tax=Synaphobranchus kaupii TaxID=118154 RepID=A0A9Q1ELH6_SYNKA|nr:hypothetical protein SKAU_G00332940 [Synaphobranchus kaupii]